MEKYKQIDGYENYSVSNLGNVKTKNWYGSGKEAVLRPAKDKKGYLRVALSGNKKLKSYRIHRLVAITFIPNPENKPQVNHINGIKTDNRAENLEWCTCSENQIHAIKTGLTTSRKGISRNAPWTIGENNINSILTEADVIEIRNKFRPRVYTRKMLAQEYGVKESTIKDVVIKKSWHHV